MTFSTNRRTSSTRHGGVQRICLLVDVDLAIVCSNLDGGEIFAGFKAIEATQITCYTVVNVRSTRKGVTNSELGSSHTEERHGLNNVRNILSARWNSNTGKAKLLSLNSEVRVE
jgi:hypothetical protein